MAIKPRVLITEPITEVGIKLLEPSCDLITPWREKRTFNEAELKSAEGLIVRLVQVDAALIARAPNLKVAGWRRASSALRFRPQGGVDESRIWGA